MLYTSLALNTKFVCYTGVLRRSRPCGSKMLLRKRHVQFRSRARAVRECRTSCRRPSRPSSGTRWDGYPCSASSSIFSLRRPSCSTRSSTFHSRRWCSGGIAVCRSSAVDILKGRVSFDVNLKLDFLELEYLDRTEWPEPIYYICKIPDCNKLV